MNTTTATTRKPAQGKWLLLRRSDITGLTYLDGRYAQERSARKELARLNQYDHHSAHFTVMHANDVKAVYRRRDVADSLIDALGRFDWAA